MTSNTDLQHTSVQDVISHTISLVLLPRLVKPTHSNEGSHPIRIVQITGREKKKEYRNSAICVKGGSRKMERGE